MTFKTNGHQICVIKPKTLENIMKIIKKIMIKYPLLSNAILFPLTLVFTLAIFSLLIELVLPFLIAFMLTNWIYGTIVGNSFREKAYEPFSYIRTKYYSM